jgi:hypothetical protein
MTPPPALPPPPPPARRLACRHTVNRDEGKLYFTLLKSKLDINKERRMGFILIHSSKIDYFKKKKIDPNLE